MAIQIQKLLAVFRRILKLSPKDPQKQEAIRRIGLNLGRSSLTACEALIEDGKIILERLIRKEVVLNKPLTPQIKDLFAEAGFQSKHVHVSLKGQGVVIRFVSFPRMNRADFASSIQFEAEKYLPFSVSEVVLDYHIIDEGAPKPGEYPEGMPVILVAARRAEIEKLLNAVQGAGLVVDAIDVDAFACANAFERAMPEAKSRAIGLIDFGAVDTTFMILEKGRMTFSRDIAFGGNDLAEMIRRKLNVPLEEAAKIQLKASWTQPDHLAAVSGGLDRLFQEIKSSLNYYYNQHQNAAPVETVYISGGFSQLGLLPELLEKQAEIPVRKWDPTKGLAVHESIRSEMLEELRPYLPVSIGLIIHPK